MAGVDRRRNSTPIESNDWLFELHTKCKTRIYVCKGSEPDPDHRLAILENGATFLVKVNMYSYRIRKQVVQHLVLFILLIKFETSAWDLMLEAIPDCSDTYRSPGGCKSHYRILFLFSFRIWIVGWIAFYG